MSAGWQVLVYAVAFLSFLIALVVDLVQSRRPGWPFFVALGLALVTLVALWNANAVYD